MTEGKKVRLSTGETVLVQLLSPYVQQALLVQAGKQAPDPDPEPFRLPLANAIDPSLKEPPESNPKYIKERNAAVIKRMAIYYELIIKAGVVAGVIADHGLEPQEVTIERYASKLVQIRKVIPDLTEHDPWTDTVLYGLIGARSDVNLIGDAARGSLAEEEIAAASKSFRRNVQQPGSPVDTGK